MLLEPEDLHSLTQAVMAGAAHGSGVENADGVGIVAALEGGYDPARASKGRPRPSKPQVRPVSARRLASTCRLFPDRYGLRTSNAKVKSRNPGSDAGSP